MAKRKTKRRSKKYWTLSVSQFALMLYSVKRVTGLEIGDIISKLRDGSMSSDWAWSILESTADNVKNDYMAIIIDLGLVWAVRAILLSMFGQRSFFTLGKFRVKA